jgi:phosphoribosylanthranilate isomerase
MLEQKNLQIKVCGMRDPMNLEQVCALLPEYIGYIFYPRSKRFVGTRPDPVLFEIPGPGIKKVGVFVDEELRQVKNIIELYGLDAVQLHGSESASYCQELAGDQLEVFKMLDPHASISELENYLEVVDHFLFDSAGQGKGGTGQKFNWKLLEDLPPSASFLLSGGIGPRDTGLIRALDLNGLLGVDINSKFELSPGLKDIELLKEFVIEIRK